MNENMTQNNEVIEIDLLGLFYALLRRWWLILISAVIGAVTMYQVTTNLITPMYESTSTLYILNKTTSITSIADIQVGSELSTDFQVIAKSKPVLDGAIEMIEEENNMTFTREDILEGMEVSTIEDTRLLVISVQHQDPQTACIIANAVAEVTATRMAEITKSDPPTMAEWAEVSKKPVSPSMVKNVVLGFVLSAFVMCLILAIIYLADDNIKTEEDVAKYLDAPTLATISFVNDKERKKQAREKKKRNKKKETRGY